MLDGRIVKLQTLAVETARRHLARHPEDRRVYGPDLAEEWCVHDMQWVLAWAFGDVAGLIDLHEQAGWLARILRARDYPVGNYWDAFEEAAGVVRDQVAGGEPVAARLLAVRPSAAPS